MSAIGFFSILAFGSIVGLMTAVVTRLVVFLLNIVDMRSDGLLPVRALGGDEDGGNREVGIGLVEREDDAVGRVFCAFLGESKISSKLLSSDSSSESMNLCLTSFSAGLLTPDVLDSIACLSLSSFSSKLGPEGSLRGAMSNPETLFLVKSLMAG